MEKSARNAHDVLSRRSSLAVWSLSLTLLLASEIHAPLPAKAIFHLAVIDEVMTSYDGDPDVQFVEVRMLALFQVFVTNTVIGAFGADGTYLGDVLVLPNDLMVQGADVPWIMGTAAFAAVSGVTPDFLIPPGLATGAGMVCWGAPGNGLSVPDPSSWDHTDPNNYTDCLAYGGYSGPTNDHAGTPSNLTADGHSLQRVGEAEDNATDFACADAATPQNNSSESASLPATTPCQPPCVGDCDGNDLVTLGEVQNSLDTFFESRPLSQCPAADGNGSGDVSLGEVQTALDNFFEGCPPPSSLGEKEVGRP